MAGQLTIRGCRVQRAPVGKGWIIVHPDGDKTLGEYDDEYQAREVARALSTLGYARGGVRPWRVTYEYPHVYRPADLIVWARSAESAGEVACRVAAKAAPEYRDPFGYTVINAVELTGERPEVEAPRHIGIDVWEACTCDNATDYHPKYPHLRRARWRGLGEIIADLNARIDASDLSTEYHGGSGLMDRHATDATVTIPAMHGADRLWRIVVSVVTGANEGHYVHVWSMGQASGAGRTAISLYTVKVLAGEVEAETIAACLRDCINEG
jgi:hypothetical protein